MILDTDYSFTDLKGLSALVTRLIQKLQHAPQIGIVVATREKPADINAREILPLKDDDIKEMCTLKGWKVKEEFLSELYDKSKGNPLLVVLLHACWVKAGKLPGSSDIKEILDDFLSHIKPEGKELLIRLAVALSAPFEGREKNIEREILLSNIQPIKKGIFETLLVDLSKMGVIYADKSIWMHDELIEQILQKASEADWVKYNYNLAKTTKASDPLRALWHFMMSKEIYEALELIELAINFSFEKLQTLRFIQTFKVLAEKLEELIEKEKQKEKKAEYLVYLGLTLSNMGSIEDKAGNNRRAIQSYNEALKVYTLKAFPMDYAGTQNNLGVAYQTLAKVEDKAENCQKAIEAYDKALNVRTLEKFPMDYAMTQNNRGAAYQTLSQVEDKAQNYQKAFAAYKEAYEIYERLEIPVMTQMVAGNIGRLRDFCGREGIDLDL